MLWKQITKIFSTEHSHHFLNDSTRKSHWLFFRLVKKQCAFTKNAKWASVLASDHAVNQESEFEIMNLCTVILIGPLGL